MDYISKIMFFKLKKVFRYLLIYGFRRTRIKIESQLHLKRTYQILPKCNVGEKSRKHIGIVGCGNFSYSTIAYYLTKNFGNVIRGAYDINANRSASLFQKYNLDYYTKDCEEIFDDKKINLVFIASNHFSHADYAISALKKNKSVHIEKPHIVSFDQLTNLCRTIIEYKGKVNIGFNRPLSKFGNIVMGIIEKENDSAIINWFIAGHKLERNHWYFDQKEGSRVLGNLSHWIDFTYHLVRKRNIYPIIIKPTRSDSVDENFVLNYQFNDKSIATISFSAKGQLFEGVHERLNLHSGNILLSLYNFQKLQIHNNELKYYYRNIFRDHGHERVIKKSFEMSMNKIEPLSVNYIWEIGELMLKSKMAIEQNKEMIIDSGFSNNKLN